MKPTARAQAVEHLSRIAAMYVSDPPLPLGVGRVGQAGAAMTLERTIIADMMEALRELQDREFQEPPNDYPQWRAFMAEHGKGLTPEKGGIILLSQRTMDEMTMFGTREVELPEWMRVQHFPLLPDDWGAAVVDTSSVLWPE